MIVMVLRRTRHLTHPTVDYGNDGARGSGMEIDLERLARKYAKGVEAMEEHAVASAICGEDGA